MKKFHLLSMILVALFLCAGTAFGAQAPAAGDDGTSVKLTESSRALLAQLGMDLPILYDDVQAVLGNEGCAPVEQMGTGHAECNDYCFAQAKQCKDDCAGNQQCIDECEDAELCCNCDCGALPPAICAWYGC